MIEERTIAAASHGRYVVAVPPHLASRAPDAAPAASHPTPISVLLGFHGYAEDARMQLDRLKMLPNADRWLIVSVQALHRFYRGRSQDVVASWMTRQDRELMIADNVAYVRDVLEAVSREWNTDGRLMLAGFSQGVAMAFRVATLGSRPTRGVIALGGDIPPELDREALSRIPAVLIGRGAQDDLYPEATFEVDQARLRTAGVDVRPHTFEGRHEWTSHFSEAAGAFLDGRW
jgi:predicted esterase